MSASGPDPDLGCGRTHLAATREAATSTGRPPCKPDIPSMWLGQSGLAVNRIVGFVVSMLGCLTPSLVVLLAAIIGDFGQHGLP